MQEPNTDYLLPHTPLHRRSSQSSRMTLRSSWRSWRTPSSPVSPLLEETSLETLPSLKTWRQPNALQLRLNRRSGIIPKRSNLEAVNYYVVVFRKHGAILHFGNTYSRDENLVTILHYCNTQLLACPALKPLLFSAAVTLTIAGSRGKGNREED